MIFTKAGRVLASLAVLLGVDRVALGLYAAATNSPAVLARYLGSGTSGEAIDSGVMVVAAGLALGVLTDISRSVRK